MDRLNFTELEKRFYMQLKKEGYQRYDKCGKVFMVKVEDKSKEEIVEEHKEAIDKICLKENTVEPILIEEGFVKGNKVLIINDY